MENERRYTTDELTALAAAEVAKIPGARLDGFWVRITIPNPADLHIEYTMPSGFRNSASAKL
jgi:hypothetical protein